MLPEVLFRLYKVVPCTLSASELADAWRRCGLMLALSLLVTATAYGQNGVSPRFEVASIKPGGAVFSTRPNRSGGRIGWTTQLSYLIGYAYQLDFSRISGPRIVGSVYTVEATFDPAATDDEVRLMIQSLLSDRFNMLSHRVITEVDGYAMSVGKGGIKMQETRADAPAIPECGKSASPVPRTEGFVSATLPTTGVTAIMGCAASMSQLAQTLQRVTRTAVWDRTGVSGNYDFSFRFSSSLSADLGTDVPALPAALQEALGLKLEKQKGPLETLIIDRIEEPSEN